jgi:voltage-gated potassium channel
MTERRSAGERPRLSRDAGALEAFEAETGLLMLVLSLAIVPLLIVPLVADLSPGWREGFLVADWVIWALFALEYGIRLWLAPARGEFFRRNLLDLAIVVLPFLRPLRVVRSARALRLLRAGRAAAFLGRGAKTGRGVLTRHHLHYALLFSLVIVVASAVLVSELERDAGGTINSFGDGLWWALSTVTTVGYGDVFPVTAAGRGVAVGLMVLGVALFGLLAASLASYFFGREREEQVDPQIRELEVRLERIERTLREISGKLDQ